MNRKRVRLREEFIEFISLASTWPSKRSMRDHSPNGFISDGAYLRIRVGQMEDLVNIYEVIAGLHRHPASKVHLLAFLRSISYPIPDDPSRLDIVDVAKRLSTEEPPINFHEDAFLSGLDWMLRMFSRARPLVHCEHCPAEHIFECVKKVYISRGRRISKEPRLPPEEAARITQEIAGISAREYSDRICRWIVKSPWIFINSWHPAPRQYGVKGFRTGSSLIVPVKDEVYDEIRSGRLEPYDIKVDDIVVPSRSLVIQLLSEHEVSKGLPTEINATHSLRKASLVQACVLARRQKVNNNIRARLVAPAGDDESATRLEAAGFTCIGQTATLASNLPLYEQVISGKRWELDPIQTAFRMFLQFFGQVKEAPRDYSPTP